MTAESHVDVVIVGAGPVGLFAVFACGQLNLRCVLVDVLNQPGGQCISLYPDKPIYDIPARRAISGKDLIDELMAQAAPYRPRYKMGSHVVSIAGDAATGWSVTMRDGEVIACKVVIIAGGNGIFQPVRPPLDGLQSFEGRSVFYSVTRTEAFAGRRIVVAGGGDSALDWAVTLSNVSRKLYLVHRRPRFRGAPATVAALEERMRSGVVELVSPFQLSALEGDDGLLTAVRVKAISGEERRLDADVLLPFFGLSTNIGPLAKWGLDMENDKFVVQPATCMTNRPGIFAIGDIATYPGKLGLILSGFSEAAVAAHAAYAFVNPETELHFMHSTTRGDPALLSA